MNLAGIAAIGFCFCASALADAIPLARAVAEMKVQVDISGNGRDAATLKLTNTSGAPVTVVLPASSLLEAKTGERQVTLRTLEATIAEGGSAEAMLPTAALATRNAKSDRPMTLRGDTELRLAPLLKLVEGQNDLPQATAQLAVFIILEDIEWAAWRAWVVGAIGRDATDAPTPAEIAQAVDALGLVRLAMPDKKPALLASEELKRLALRNPQVRGKAGALYGLTLENAVTGEPALPPDLKQLLHMSPNDNCPVCRQRQKLDADLP